MKLYRWQIMVLLLFYSEYIKPDKLDYVVMNMYYNKRTLYNKYTEKCVIHNKAQIPMYLSDYQINLSVVDIIFRQTSIILVFVIVKYWNWNRELYLIPRDDETASNKACHIRNDAPNI